MDPRLFYPGKYDKEYIRKTLGVPSEVKLCVYCGRVDEWAGKTILENIASRFEAQNRPIMILVTGDYRDKPKFKNIVSVGVKPYKEIPLLLSSADVVLVPFPNEDYAHAASPLKLFEAMAMACPIVSSNISGIQEIFNNCECGILINPTNIEEWCKSILSLLQNPLLAQRLGKCARKIVEKRYDWEVLTEKYEKTLIELISLRT